MTRNWRFGWGLRAFGANQPYELIAFDLGNLKKPGSRPVFGDNVTEVLCRKLAAPVGRQAIARFPRP
jgi:hypothetical protein